MGRGYLWFRPPPRHFASLRGRPEGGVLSTGRARDRDDGLASKENDCRLLCANLTLSSAALEGYIFVCTILRTFADHILTKFWVPPLWVPPSSIDGPLLISL